MKKLTLSRSSRYAGTPLYQLRDSIGVRTNSVAFGVWRRIVIPDRSDDSIHYVSESDIGRLDSLANTYYADPLLWWAIADKNGINDPMTDMYVGQELRVPVLSSITDALASAASSR